MGIIDELKDMFNMSESRRRSHVGMDVTFWNAGELGIIDCFSPPQNDVPDVVLGDVELENKQLMEMLRRSKMYLGMRKPDEELIKRLERRREWNIASRPIENNLDLFAALKYSYSSAMPCNKGQVDVVVSSDGRARFSGVAHSNNMRLDPVDARKISYRRRLEIQRALQWGYDNGFIPVMMTLTIFHDYTWQPLTKLIAVLRKSYEDLFGHKVGEKLKKSIGFQYRIYRMEETLDMKSPLVAHDENGKLDINVQFGKGDGIHGWHPHYHVVLFVPKDNLNILSDLEPKLKARWQRLVQKYYARFVGKEIPESYLSALYKHGLMISRYSEDVRDRRGRVVHKQGELYQVDDSKYLAKIMGCDSAEMYGGDKEMSASMQKDSMSPFDLLRGKPTAETADLWNEYAVATKGLSCFRFTKGFKAVIDEYFEQHPDRDPVKIKNSKELTIAPLREEVYHLLYRNLKLEEAKRTIADFVKIAGLNVVKLHDLLFEWFKKLFVDWGLDEPSEEDLFVFARPPD